MAFDDDDTHTPPNFEPLVVFGLSTDSPRVLINCMNKYPLGCDFLELRIIAGISRVGRFDTFITRGSGLISRGLRLRFF